MNEKKWIKTRKGVIITPITERYKGIPKYNIRFGKGLIKEIGEDTTISIKRPRKLKDLDGEVFTLNAIEKMLMVIQFLREEVKEK